MRSHNPVLLPIIILSQFAGTSLWFAGNAILPDLQQQLQLDSHAISRITSAVQLGFISGTLIFAVLSVSDRFSPSKVFLACSFLAASANMMVAWTVNTEWTLLVLRFTTGLFLAGIYPVGMKIAADWYREGLGKALGFLVGALVLGTSFPHLLKSAGIHLPWKQVLLCTSVFAMMGGLLVGIFIKDGPYRSKGAGFQPQALVHVFRSPSFKAASIAYFGHMWELYTFWAFLPLVLQWFKQQHQSSYNVSLLAFIIIASGSIGSALSGYWAGRAGSARVAWYALLCSGCCCLLLPFALQLPLALFIIFLLIWSLSAIADSPQLSTLVAQTAPAAHKGTALTFITCIGFSMTVISMFMFDYLLHLANFSTFTFMVLAFGPLAGLLALRKARAITI
jgi:MFS family permease